jgi:DNA-directed RNA polymerase specialized sigma24 family protein
MELVEVSFNACELAPLDLRFDGPHTLYIVESYSRETLERIRAAIIVLPEPTRTILRLTRLEGRTQRETAEQVGVTTTTVENHLPRALSVGGGNGKFNRS